MPKNLVIVESPAKAKTIQKYLGNEFEVLSSFGHITDLPKKDMGIDIQNNFKPKYEVSVDKKEVVKKLKQQAKQAETIWLASDEDREGEAISWHIYNELKLKPENTKRIVFHEITQKAIQKAIENPRSIDINLVNAQQARRVLDRIVGFEMSPVLWKKIKPGLSAGRVQSVALRLIAEREKEIEKFIPVSNLKVKALFSNKENKELSAQLDTEFKTKNELIEFLNKCNKEDFQVEYIEKKPTKRTPPAPFTTSTLQQEASLKLGMSVSRTMRIAQQLYESGHITYMRTDSVNLSQDAINLAEQMIKSEYGTEYSKPRTFQTKSKGAQEAHEAIRPTNMNLKSVGSDNDQVRLYELIWKRTVAGQMSEAKLEKTVIDIISSKIKEKFIATGEVIIFDGFLKLYQEHQEKDEDSTDKKILPKVNVGEKLNTINIQGTERFTRPLPRYTEASLVKKLEELGIGRPSTYAPTISTIQQREYVIKGTREGIPRKYIQITLENNKISEKELTEMYGSDKNKLIPTDIGVVVSDFLTEHFGKILEYNFTAKVEENFDEIALGNEEWTKMLGDFYQDFHANVENVNQNAERASGNKILGKDPVSGKDVQVRIGKFGPMVQIGNSEDEEKPKYASLLKDQNISTISLEQALKLFELPRNLGLFEQKEIEVNNGRFGPYIKYNEAFISLPKDLSPSEITLDEAIELIQNKQKADAPIHKYEGFDVTKGSGRFGPFIKWNGIFINVPRKFDFNNLSIQDIEFLIEDKKQKNIDKVIHFFETENILVEKGRWGTATIIHGKLKINLPKTVEASKLTLEEIQKIIDQNKPSKKTSTKTTNKTTKK